MLASVAAIAALTFRDYGLGWDDYAHSQYGDLLLALYSSGFRDQRALSFVNLYKYGGGFDMAAALAAKVLPFGLFETRRLVGAAVGAVLGVLFAPDKGSATRKKISQKASDFTDTIKEKFTFNGSSLCQQSM